MRVPQRGPSRSVAGAHADQPLRCEIKVFGTPTLKSQAEGNTECGVNREPQSCPAQSKSLCLRGNSLHGNREISSVPCAAGGQGRSEKAVRPRCTLTRSRKVPIVPLAFRTLLNSEGDIFVVRSNKVITKTCTIAPDVVPRGGQFKEGPHEWRE